MEVSHSSLNTDRGTLGNGNEEQVGEQANMLWKQWLPLRMGRNFSSI